MANKRFSKSNVAGSREVMDILYVTKSHYLP